MDFKFYKELVIIRTLLDEDIVKGKQKLTALIKSLENMKNENTKN